MAFGQSKSEKAQDATITANQKQIGDISSSAATKGDKSFKWFKQAGTQAKDYWSSILGGDKSAIDEFLGPELSRITSIFGGQRQQQAEFSPRGGARASGNTALATQEASMKGDAVLKARPEAAQALGGLAGLFGGIGQGFTGQALSGLGEGANIGFGLNKEQQANREATAALWTGIGSAAGEAAGGWLGGK